jgi:hypothetical protein
MKLYSHSSVSLGRRSLKNKMTILLREEKSTCLQEATARGGEIPAG